MELGEDAEEEEESEERMGLRWRFSRRLMSRPLKGARIYKGRYGTGGTACQNIDHIMVFYCSFDLFIDFRCDCASVCMPAWAVLGMLWVQAVMMTAFSNRMS